MTLRIAFVAPLPPPVHGFSNISAAMLERLRGTASTQVFDRAPSRRGRAVGFVRQVLLPLKYLLWCMAHRRSELYLALSGGLGQVFDLPYVAVSRALRRPIFVHHHSFAYINSPGLLSKLMFGLLKDADHIVLSRQMGTELQRIYGLEPRRIRVISNAAFYEPMGEPIRGPGPAGAPLRIGYLSAVSVEKGIVDFFAVLRELRTRQIPYEAQVAGPIAADAQAIFRELLAGAHDVTYHGPLYDEAKRNFYANLDLLLFPTDYVNEAEPLVILEAIRSGIHVVACDRGAIRELLSNGAGEVVEKPAFVSAAVARICALSANRGELRRLQQLSLEQAQRLRDGASGDLAAFLRVIGGSLMKRPGTHLSHCLILVLFTLGGSRARADVEYHDTLEKALLPPALVDAGGSGGLDFFVADQESYDDNLFRLPSNFADLTTLIGPTASRADHINTSSAGLDGQWISGRQVVTVDLRADDNRFARNDDLNYVGSSDAATWNWGVGDRISGQVGADFARTLGGFYNTNIYTRDVVDREEYFGAARYQVGPHVSVYGGLLLSETSLSAAAAAINDNHRKIVDLGMDYALGASSTFGLDYRYTDARYSHTAVLNGVSFNPDYRDEAIRASFTQTLSERTQIEAVAGYLKRDYPSTAIGRFQGYIWRLSVDWHPTEKTELLLAGSRDLQADLSAQTDYFVSNAVSLSPTWSPTERISLALTALHDQLTYIGSNGFLVTIGQRRDQVNAAQAGITYTPITLSGTRGLTLTASYRREHRSSNQLESSYDDSIGRVGFTFKF